MPEPRPSLRLADAVLITFRVTIVSRYRLRLFTIQADSPRSMRSSTKRLGVSRDGLCAGATLRMALLLA
jgi:hypothetical protein